MKADIILLRLLRSLSPHRTRSVAGAHAARCLLRDATIAAAFLLLAPWAAAQDDISGLLTGQSQQAQEAAAQAAAQGVRAAQAARAAQAEDARTALLRDEDAGSAQPLRATTGALGLLGTAYEPREGAMFGEQLFQPGMMGTYGAGFNADYTLAIGDRISLRMWGAFSYQDMQTVDAQGNVFVPNVGPIRVAGVRNFDLNDVMRAAIGEIYRENVEVYASLEASQPVRVFVTGFVRAPGQYAGVAADSVLDFLLRAGGVDPARGSYIDIRVQRGGEERAAIDLYEFLLEGRLPQVQIQDGDTIVVGGRRNTVRVRGDVFNSVGFEFAGTVVPATDILALASPTPGATHATVVHKDGIDQLAQHYPLDALENVMLSSGDELNVVADRRVTTVVVRVEGAIESESVLTLPYGSTLQDALDRVDLLPQATPEAVQLYRESVAVRQRDMLDVSLRVLETQALTARSTTSEEANLRAREAERILQFITRARAVQPRGQVVLAGRETAMDALLDDGDRIVIPERSSFVLVHGEVTQPNAIAYDRRSRVSDYIELAGGTTQNRRNARILLLRQDGTFVEDRRATPEPGDEIIVLPTVGTRNVEVARGLSQILFQLAVVARVALDL